MLPLTDGWAQAVREHTDGPGVDVVVDPIGGPAFDDAIRVSLGLKPPPPRHYPLSQRRAALQALADGTVFGKLVPEP